jgi:TRAP-type C4-dicarboxylate transport system permease small subunit
VIAAAGTAGGAITASPHPVMKLVEIWIARIVGAFAALAVLVEVAILLIGVIFRFGLNRPLVWSDELASIVFLWLAMLGSVLALFTGEHMRLTTIAMRLPARWRARAEVLATLTPLLLLALLIKPALDYMDDQSFVETPALGWPDAVRAAAVPVGFALMLALSAIRLTQFRLRDIAGVGAALALAAAALWLAMPVLGGLGN